MTQEQPAPRAVNHFVRAFSSIERGAVIEATTRLEADLQTRACDPHDRSVP